jgi:hypothetical protein
MADDALMVDQKGHGWVFIDSNLCYGVKLSSGGLLSGSLLPFGYGKPGQQKMSTERIVQWGNHPCVDLMILSGESKTK